jgi:Protein of unknown function (DUF4239)
VSQWLVLTLAIAAVCALVLIIVVVAQRRVGDDDDTSETPDVIEYMTMMIGVVFVIVLGLAIAGVWEARGAAQDDVRREAQALHEVSARVQVYPAPVRDRVRGDIDAYVDYVVHTEWSYTADHGKLNDRGTELLARVRDDVTKYKPANDYESQSYQPLVDQVAAADDARHARGLSARGVMPTIVWVGLIAGAVVMIGMIFMLQIRRSRRELLLAGLFSAFIAFLLFMIWEFDAPFSHGINATTGAFRDLFPDVFKHK